MTTSASVRSQLIGDLSLDQVGEELSATEVDEGFIGERRTALQGLEQRP